MKRGNYLNSRQLLFQRALLKSQPICLIDAGGNRHTVQNVVRMTNTESFTQLSNALTLPVSEDRKVWLKGWSLH